MEISRNEKQIISILDSIHMLRVSVSFSEQIVFQTYINIIVMLLRKMAYRQNSVTFSKILLFLTHFLVFSLFSLKKNLLIYLLDVRVTERGER